MGTALCLKGGSAKEGTGFRRAAKAQSEVDWFHMFKGRIVKEWGLFHKDTAERDRLHTKVAAFFLEWGRACWINRCEVVNATRTVKMGSVIYDQIKTL